jgi:GxxExxY protein
MTPTTLLRSDLLYPDLSYKIVGVLIEVHKQLGFGFNEKTYQNAVAVGLKKAGLKYIEQLYAPVMLENKVVGKNFFDFLVEDKIVVELKRGDKFARAHIEQVYNYLVAKKLQLGILAYFGPRNLHFKRIVNIVAPENS